MYHTLVSVVSVLSVLAIRVVTAAPTATPIIPATVGSILSLETGRFLMFSEDGRISAGGGFGTLESTLSVRYLADDQLSIQSVNTLQYLIFENGQIQAGKPHVQNRNDLLEIVRIKGDEVALRVVHSEVNSGSGSGSGEMDETPSDCYIGFPYENSEPKCYTTSEFAATRFIILHRQ